MLCVVLNEKFASGCHHSQVDDVVSLCLNAAQDLADEVSLHTVGLDEDESVV